MKKGIVLLIMMAVAICAATETTKKFSVDVSDVKEAKEEGRFNYDDGGMVYDFFGLKIKYLPGGAFGIGISHRYSDAEYVELTSGWDGPVVFSLGEEYADWKIKEIKIHSSSLGISYLEDESINVGWYKVSAGEMMYDYYWNDATPQPSVSIWGDLSIYYIEVVIEKNELLSIGNADYVLKRINDHYFVEEKNIEFHDGSNFNLNYDTFVDNLTYSRNFKYLGVWQAWAVPFDVDVKTMNEQGLEVAEIAGIVMKDSETYVGFVKMNGGIVNGNVPYVVRASQNNVTLNMMNVTLLPSNEVTDLTIQSAYDNFTFTPIMKPVRNSELYALNTKGEFQLLGEAQLSPQRFTLAVEHRTDSPYYSDDVNVKAFKIIVMGDDLGNVDAIENIREDENKDENIYNLNGLRVDKSYKGIVIKNGKKYLNR